MGAFTVGGEDLIQIWGGSENGGLNEDDRNNKKGLLPPSGNKCR
jgi:hypothetical protein